MTAGGIRRAAIMTAVYTVLACSLMLYRAGTKKIQISDTVTARQDERFEESFGKTASAQYELLISEAEDPDESGSGKLVIPLPGVIRAEDVILEDRYLYRQLVITVPGGEADFYETHEIISSLGDKLIQSRCVFEEGRSMLLFQLSDILVSESELDLIAGRLQVNLYVPDERYDAVVIVNAADGGTGAQTAALIKERLDQNQSVKIYYTQLGGNMSQQPESERITEADIEDLFLSSSGASLFIQVGAREEAPGFSGITAWYNDRFFLRDFPNVAFADLMERNTATVAARTARGVFAENNENSVLYRIRIPAVYISLGNPKNSSDVEYLEDEAYLNRAADGIVQGIMAAIDELADN